MAQGKIRGKIRVVGGIEMKCQICPSPILPSTMEGTLCSGCEEAMTRMFLDYNGFSFEDLKRLSKLEKFVINQTEFDWMYERSLKQKILETDDNSFDSEYYPPIIPSASELSRFNYEVAVRIKEILDRNQLLKQLIQKFGISGTRKFLKEHENPPSGKMDGICACENCVGEDYEFESMYADILNYEESK